MSAKRARGSEEPRLCRVAGRKVWYVYHKARRFSTRATSRAEAEAFLADFRAALDRPQPGTTISLSEILDRYLADRRDAQIPGLDRLEWAHKALKRFWGERPPECITDAECRLYVRQRAVEHSGPHYKTASASTARTELQALNAALQWACKKEFISKAPRIVLPQRPPPRERWLTREEADRLIASCGAHHIRVFVEIALRTGARSGAIKSLTWDRVDFGQRLIDFREPGRIQTRKKRVQVHIVDILLPVLQEAYEMRTTQWVIE
jgi:integrase